MKKLLLEYVAHFKAEHSEDYKYLKEHFDEEKGLYFIEALAFEKYEITYMAYIREVDDEKLFVVERKNKGELVWKIEDKFIFE